MKILQVNCVYKKGSTGKIVFDIHSELVKRGIESVVCYGRGDKIIEPNVYKTCGELYSKMNNLWSRFTGLMYGGCGLSTNKLIKIIKKENPNVVHLHCINGYFVNIYRLVNWLKKSGIKTILTLHAEFMYTANCGHSFECEKWKTGCGKCPRNKIETKSLIFDRTHSSWQKMKKAFDGFDNLTVVSVSEWLKDRAMQSPMLKDKNHQVVYNGLDTKVFNLVDASDLREIYSPNGEKIIFHATAHFSDSEGHNKGGRYIIELAKRLKDQNVKVLVAGPYDQGLQVPDNLVLLGSVSDQELLAKYYAMADLTVIASKKETFSMICAESFCCGTPVVGFKAGAPEQISIKEFSTFVEYGDINALQQEVQAMLEKKFDKKEISLQGQKRYSKERMLEEVCNLYGI